MRLRADKVGIHTKPAIPGMKFPFRENFAVGRNQTSDLINDMKSGALPQNQLGWLFSPFSRLSALTQECFIVHAISRVLIIYFRPHIWSLLNRSTLVEVVHLFPPFQFLTNTNSVASNGSPATNLWRKTGKMKPLFAPIRKMRSIYAVHNWLADGQNL